MAGGILACGPSGCSGCWACSGRVTFPAFFSQDGLQEKNPVRNFLDDPRRSGPFAESDRREGSRRHVRNWGGSDFDKIKTGMEHSKERSSPVRMVALMPSRFTALAVLSPLSVSVCGVRVPGLWPVECHGQVSPLLAPPPLQASSYRPTCLHFHPRLVVIVVVGAGEQPWT